MDLQNEKSQSGKSLINLSADEYTEETSHNNSCCCKQNIVMVLRKLSDMRDPISTL
jgi:hypothetical protein